MLDDGFRILGALALIGTGGAAFTLGVALICKWLKWGGGGCHQRHGQQ